MSWLLIQVCGFFLTQILLRLLKLISYRWIFSAYFRTDKSLSEQYIEANPENPTSKTWSPTAPNEIKLFLPLYLLTGIVQKLQIKQFWSTDPLLQTALFNQVMARNRFTEILKLFHFVDNSNYNANDPNRDKMYKGRGIVESLVDQFKMFVYPHNTFLSMKIFCYGRVDYHSSNTSPVSVQDLE